MDQFDTLTCNHDCRFETLCEPITTCLPIIDSEVLRRFLPALRRWRQMPPPMRLGALYRCATCQIHVYLTRRSGPLLLQRLATPAARGD